MYTWKIWDSYKLSNCCLRNINSIHTTFIHRVITMPITDYVMKYVIPVHDEGIIYIFYITSRHLSRYYLCHKLPVNNIDRKLAQTSDMNDVCQVVAPLVIITCEVRVLEPIKCDADKYIIMRGLRDMICDPIFSVSDIHAMICQRNINNIIYK
jgi:hypothetical protein